MKPDEILVFAQVVPVSSSGSDLLKHQQVTTKNIHSFQSSPETINKARIKLQELGFKTEIRDMSFSISGKKKLFEDVFSLKLDVKKKDETTYFIARKKATIPSHLKGLITGIVFPEPMEFFP